MIVLVLKTHIESGEFPQALVNDAPILMTEPRFLRIWTKRNHTTLSGGTLVVSRIKSLEIIVTENVMMSDLWCNDDVRIIKKYTN